MSSNLPIQTVMLIDDEEIDHLIYKRVMTRSKIVGEIISFTYAQEALDHLKQHGRESVDVIFLDINMPRMNGFEFLETAYRELGDDFASAVVIMLTTSLNPKDRERAAEFSVVKKFINKPLTAEHLEEITSLLEHK